jgi:hypothetical protein
MDQTVDCCHGCCGVPEHLIPRGEGQISHEHDVAAFVAVSHQSEDDLHLVPALLDLAHLIDHEAVIASHPLEVPFGDEIVETVKPREIGVDRPIQGSWSMSNSARLIQSTFRGSQPATHSVSDHRLHELSSSPVDRRTMELWTIVRHPFGQIGSHDCAGVKTG